MTPAFVLVHGAMVGGWCWTWVTPHLRAAGFEVHTPTLTGLGERAHLAGPQVSLATHVDDVVNVLEYADLRDVLLVGWSYGGMVVAGVADRVPDRMAQLVYLDSDVPRDGETSAPASSHDDLMALARAYGDGWRVPYEVTRVPALLLDGLPDDRRRWVEARLAPHPVATWLEPIRLSGAGDRVATTYIRCTADYDPEDEDTRRQDARIAAEPAWRVVSLAERHAAPFTAPEELARTLVDIARA